MRQNDKKCLYFLSGLCTEFSVDRGVINIHRPTPCGKEQFPSCSKTYKSSEAYKCKTTYFSKCICFILNMSLFNVLFSFTYNFINAYIYFNY